MGRKVKLSSLLIKPKEYWPSCTQNPKTVSFRIDHDDNIFKTLNSVYFDPLTHGGPLAAVDESTPDSWFSRHYNYTTSASTASCPSSRDESDSEEEEDDINVVRIGDGDQHGDGRVDSSDHQHDPDPDPVEEVIRGARCRDSSTRLFFNPDETSSALMVFEKKMKLVTSTDYVDHRQEIEEETNVNFKKTDQKEKDILISTVNNQPNATPVENYSPPPFVESVVMALESEDPYEDFKRSMEEMVLTHDMIKDWGCLEELLCWYLRVNGKDNHGYIVAAFVDLLVKFSSTPDQDDDDDDGCTDITDQDGGDDDNLDNHNRVTTSTTFSSAASSFCSSSSTLAEEVNFHSSL